MDLEPIVNLSEDFVGNGNANGEAFGKTSSLENIVHFHSQDQGLSQKWKNPIKNFMGEHFTYEYFAITSIQRVLQLIHTSSG